MLVRLQPMPRFERREYGLRAPYDDTFVSLMKQLPGAYWAGAEGTWCVPEDLLRPAVERLRRHDFEMVDHATRAPVPEDPLPARPYVPLPRPDHPLLAKLRPYQRMGVEWVLDKSALWRQRNPYPWKWNAPRPDGGIYWFAMGLGKTLAALAAATQLPGPYLVIVPGLIRAVWAGRKTKDGYEGGEIRKWLGPDVDIRVARGLDPFVARRVAIAARDLAAGENAEDGWARHADVRAKVLLATDDMADAIRECVARGVLEVRKAGRRALYRPIPGVDGPAIARTIRPAVVRDLTPATWIVISYETLDFRIDHAEQLVDPSSGKTKYRFFDPPWFDLLCEISPSVVVADEIHLFKRWKSHRAEAIRVLTDRVNPVLRLGLTGTLFYNRPIDVYAPLAWAAPKHGDMPAAFGNRWGFAGRYCDAHPAKYGWEVSGVSHPDELKARLAFHAMRRTKDEVMADLPSKTRQVLSIEAVKGKEYVDKALQKLGRAPTPNEMRKILSDLGPMKIPTAVELVDTTDGRVCVYTHRRDTADAAAKALRTALGEDQRDVFLSTGDVEIGNREIVYDRWRNSDRGVLVATMEVVAVGIDLSAGNVAIFIDLDYIPGKLLQVEDRQHRQGQRNAVTIYYIAVENTLDERVANLLIEKLTQLESVAGLDSDAADLKANLGREEDILDALVRRIAAGTETF